MASKKHQRTLEKQFNLRWTSEEERATALTAAALGMTTTDFIRTMLALPCLVLRHTEVVGDKKQLGKSLQSMLAIHIADEGSRREVGVTGTNDGLILQMFRHQRQTIQFVLQNFAATMKARIRFDEKT